MTGCMRHLHLSLLLLLKLQASQQKHMHIDCVGMQVSNTMVSTHLQGPRPCHGYRYPSGENAQTDSAVDACNEHR